MRSSVALLTVLLVLAAAGVGSAAGQPVANRPQATDAHDPPDPVSLQAVVDSATDVTVVNGTSTNGTAQNETDNGTNSNVTGRDETNIRVQLRENGDARWHVTAQFVLEDANETAAFERLARRYENGRSDVGFSIDTFERVARKTAESRDRSMEIRNENYSADLRSGGNVGVLALSFTWTNFSQVSGDQLVLGDAFWTDSGTWLPKLTDRQVLTIDGPSGYYVSRSNVPHNGTRIRYEGPKTFESGDFSVAYRPRNDEPKGQNLPDISGPFGVLLAIGLLGASGVGAYAWTRRDGDAVTPSTEQSADLPDPASSERATPEIVTESETSDERDVELLSDEERVLRLLEANDGRMKQANIVKETNWSNAKVSQLLSAMDDEGDIDKLRIGRENLISLPDEDVTDGD